MAFLGTGKGATHCVMLQWCYYILSSLVHVNASCYWVRYMQSGEGLILPALYNSHTCTLKVARLFTFFRWNFSLISKLSKLKTTFWAGDYISCKMNTSNSNNDFMLIWAISLYTNFLIELEPFEDIPFNIFFQILKLWKLFY